MTLTNLPGHDAPLNNTGALDAPQTTPQSRGGEAQQVNDLPQWAQDVIHEARKEAKERRERIALMEQEQRAREEKRLEEQQEWQQLAAARKAELDALQPMKAKAEQADAIMAKLLEAQLAQLPPDAREMVNTMPGDTQAKLDWLATNQARLQRPLAPTLDGGPRGDQVANAKLTPEQEALIAAIPGMTRERYLERANQLDKHKGA